MPGESSEAILLLWRGQALVQPVANQADPAPADSRVGVDALAAGFHHYEQQAGLEGVGEALAVAMAAVGPAMAWHRPAVETTGFCSGRTPCSVDGISW